MAGKEDERGREVSVSERNVGCGGGSERGGDSRDDFECDSGLTKRLNFFAPTAKDEGISSFETDHLQARGGERDQKRVDLFLGNAFAAATFADVVGERGGGDEGENPGAD